MTEGVELNQGQERIENVQCSSTGERNMNISPSNLRWDKMTIPPTTSFPVCSQNSSTQILQNQPSLLAFKQFYPNMGFVHQQPSPYYQQHIRPPQFPLMQTLGDLLTSQQSTHIPSASLNSTPLMQPLGDLLASQQVTPTPSTSHNSSPFMQPLGDLLASQQSTPTLSASQNSTTVPSESSQRGNRYWSREEDLQLTIAYLKVSTDSGVGVGQKRPRLWERVRLEFVDLMHEKHGIKPECILRTEGGCENRMNEIKSQCTRWNANRERAHNTADSGWSADDIEKLCYSLHEKQGKGPFKWEECWKVLKQYPNWEDCSKKKSQDKRKAPSSGSCLVENMSNNSTAATTTFQTSNTSVTECTSDPEIEGNGRSRCTTSDREIEGNGKSRCTPILDGPGSIDIQATPGTKITKSKNQRQRKIQKHSEYQTSATKAIVDVLKSVESANSSHWERQYEMDRVRDLTDNKRYKQMLSMQVKEHKLKAGMERAEISEKMEVIGEKLLAAVHKLEELDPRNLSTSNHRMMFEYRKKAVDNYEQRYKELEEILRQTEVSPVGNNASVETSPRHLFHDEEEPIELDEDV